MLSRLLLVLEQRFRHDPRATARRLNRVPRTVVDWVRNAKLVRTLRHVYRHNPVQRERWEQAGISLSDLRSPGVLPHIPFCDGPELARNPEAFFCVPEEELIYIITTAGSGGRRKKVYFTKDEMDHQTGMIGTNLRRLPGASRVMIMYPTGDPTWSSGQVALNGVAQANMFGLLSDVGRSTREQLHLIKEYRINVLIASPTHVHRMALEAEEEVSALGVRYLLLGVRPWSEQLRGELEAAWGAKALDAYGTNECACGIAGECLYQNGLHVAETDFWVEIIDPGTGRPLPDGEEGEIVITTLSRRGMPLVRYRLGDLAHFHPQQGRCACGSPLRKLSRIRGRADGMLLVGFGANVYPEEFDQAVLGVPGVSDYRVTLKSDGDKDVLHLTVETDQGGDELRPRLLEALRGIHGIKVEHEVTRGLVIGPLETVPRGSLSADRIKASRILDDRSPT